MRTVVILAALVSLAGCSVRDDRSGAQKAWDEASENQRQLWCSTLREANAQGVLLAPIFMQSGLTENEAGEFVGVLAQNCL